MRSSPVISLIVIKSSSCPSSFNLLRDLLVLGVEPQTDLMNMSLIQLFPPPGQNHAWVGSVFPILTANEVGTHFCTFRSLWVHR
jgi:hypothetical protein